jgi:hypothetical protein
MYFGMKFISELNPLNKFYVTNFGNTNTAAMKTFEIF